MPRSETPLESDGSELTEFAVELRRLRERAGGPPYRELARRAHYSASALAGAAAGRRLPSLAVTTAFVRACGGDVAEWERRWHSVAAATAPAVDARAARDDADEAPYPGLATYQAGDADRFCGRERLVDDLVERVRERRFTAVFGPSGSGKSSVLRAGLAPRLAAGGSTAVVVFTPGADPREECAVHLARMVGGTAGAVREELVADPRNLRRLVRQALAGSSPTAEVVLVVDQFEELFTLCRDQGTRSGFIAALTGAARDDAGRCRVVLGVRSDFYTHCLLDPELAAALDGSQVAVGPMTAEELRRAIAHPARRAGCVVEGALLATLIAQTNGRPGALPLLSHALLETWRRRQGNTLTLAGFHRAGGIDAALATTADAVYTALEPRQQDLAQALLVRLVALGDGTADTKRRVARSELDHDDDTVAVLDRFTAARLVVLSDNGVELAHEALISAWPRLQRWLSEDRDAHRVHRRLTDAAATWQQHHRDPDTLLRGARLATAVEWARRHTSANRLEREFLDACVTADRRRHRSHRRRTRVLHGLVALLAVLLLVTTVAAVHATNARRNALSQRDAATALRILDKARDLIDTDPRLAAQFSLAAYRLDPSGTAADMLVAAQGATPVAGWDSAVCDCDVVLAPGGRHAAAFSEGRDLITLFLVRPSIAQEVSAVRGGRGEPAFSADGRFMATLDRDATVRLWDISDPARPRQEATLPGAHASTRFSPDGALLLTVDAVARPAGGEPGAPSWATGDTTRLWDVGDVRRPRELGALPGSAALLDVNSDNHLILTHRAPVAAGTPVERIDIWDFTDPSSPRRVGEVRDTAGTRPTAVASTGRKVVAGTAPQGLLVDWRVDAPESGPLLVANQPSSPTTVRDLVMDPGRRRAVTTGIDGQVVLWRTAAPRSPTRNPSNASLGTLEVELEFPSTWTEYGRVGFTADGRAVQGIGTEDRAMYVHQWRLDPAEAAAAVCAAGRIREVDWRPHLPDVPYRQPCG